MIVGDTEDDGDLEISDAVLVLGYLFGGTGLLLPPSVLCGIDLKSDDQLTCIDYDGCSG